MEHTTIVTISLAGNLASRTLGSTEFGGDRNTYLTAGNDSKDTAVWGTKGFGPDTCPDPGELETLLTRSAMRQVQSLWIN